MPAHSCTLKAPSIKALQLVWNWVRQADNRLPPIAPHTSTTMALPRCASYNNQAYRQRTITSKPSSYHTCSLLALPAMEQHCHCSADATRHGAALPPWLDVMNQKHHCTPNPAAISTTLRSDCSSYSMQPQHTAITCFSGKKNAHTRYWTTPGTNRRLQSSASVVRYTTEGVIQ